MSSSKLTRSTELNKNKKWSSNAESWDECFVWLSLRLRIWGSGVRIPSGAPVKSNSYVEFGVRLWLNSYQLATTRQLHKRDRRVSRIGGFGSAIRRFESSRPSHIAVRRCSLELAPVHKLLRERRKRSRIGPQPSALGFLKPTNLTVSMTVHSGYTVAPFCTGIPSWF
jgi:hypothetical protein